MLASEMVPTGEPKVIVKAVLCWSEYFNGKWQPTKTSDVNNPTTLKSRYNIYGTIAFNRSRLLLSVVEEEDALRILIEGSRQSSFLLYNTHSLPVREEDAPSPLAPPALSHMKRTLWTTNGKLHIQYDKYSTESNSWTELTHDILEYRLPALTVVPRHRLESAWDAPFFYEDSRHVFYVTTINASVPVSQSDLYYTTADSAVYPEIQPLIIPEPQPPGPGPYELGLIGLDDISTMKRFVSENPNINIAIPMKSTVLVDGAEIGPAGNVGNSIQKG